MEFTETPQHLLRQADIIPSHILSNPITIIGAGAIGSFVTLTLAKMGFEDLTVWDFDNIETHNMNSQFYRFSDIGKPKVFALRELVRDFTKLEIKPVCGEYTDEIFPGIVISAVDSMRVRRAIWDAHKGKTFATKFIIDPRMGAEDASMYVVKPYKGEDMENYEKTLHSDDDAVEERCTAKATMYCATMLSGAVSKAVKDCLTGVYTKTLQWSIKQDDLVAHRSDGRTTQHEVGEEERTAQERSNFWSQQMAAPRIFVPPAENQNINQELYGQQLAAQNDIGRIIAYSEPRYETQSFQRNINGEWTIPTSAETSE